MGQKAWNEGSSFPRKNTCWLGGTKYRVNKYCHDSHTVLYFPACNQDSHSGRKLGIAQLEVMELHLDRVFSLGKWSPLKKITIWNKNQWYFNLHWVRSKQYKFGFSPVLQMYRWTVWDNRLLIPPVCQFSKLVAGSRTSTLKMPFFLFIARVWAQLFLAQRKWTIWAIFQPPSLLNLFSPNCWQCPERKKHWMCLRWVRIQTVLNSEVLMPRTAEIPRVLSIKFLNCV